MIGPPSFTSIVIGILATAVASLYIFLLRFKRQRESTKPFPQLSSPPLWHWVIGHVALLGEPCFETSLTTLSIKYANEHGQTGFWMAFEPAIAVTNVLDAKAILHASHYRAPVSHMARHMARFLGANNITQLMGKEWKYHRAAILRAFSPSVVQQTQKEVVETSQVLVASLRPLDGAVVDVEPLMKMVTMDVFGWTSLSRDLHCCATLKPSAIAKAFDFLGVEFNRRLQSPLGLASTFYWIPTKVNRMHNRQRALIRDFIQDIVAERRDMSTNPPTDLLTYLLQAHSDLSNNATEAVSSETLTDILMSLLFAGYDSTSITLTYALYNLAKYPKAEEECLKEIQRVFASTSPKPEELVYCNAVILETLRLFPPATATSRTLTKDLTLEGGFVAEAGTFVFIPIWAIQRNAEYFPSPDEFLPERWATKRGEGLWEERSEGGVQAGVIAPANRNAFLAFSAGARSCAGSRFALMEATLVLASLVKDISFSIDPYMVVKPRRSGFMQRPDGGMPMKVTFR